MTGLEAEHGVSSARSRRRRRLAGLLLLLVALAVLLRIGLAVFAVDLFEGALRRSASQAGLEILYDGAPAVSLDGFEVRGLVVRASGKGASADRQWLSADSLSGISTFSLRSPFLRLSLKLAGGRIALPQLPGTAAGASAAFEIPEFPSLVSDVAIENGRADLGGGRVLAVDASVDLHAGGGRTVSVSRLDYSEPSGQRAAEKLAGTIRLRAPAAARAADANKAVRMEANVTSGAALLGAVLLDFHAHPLSLSGAITKNPAGGVEGSAVAMALGKLLRVTGSVQVAGDGSLRAADVNASSEDLMPAFVTLVREPFGGVSPALADAVVEGKGHLSLRLQAPSRHAADATVTLSLARLRTRSVEAENLQAEFPWIGASLARTAPRGGRLRAAKFSMLALPSIPLDTALQAAPGRVRASARQQWKIFGGTLHLNDLLLEDDAARGPRLSASMQVDRFDLGQLGDMLGISGLAGSIGGNLGRVRLDADTLRADGALDVAAFGGSGRIFNLSVEQPFDRVPALGLDATVSEIDLASLTGAFGVGRVSGVLEGRISKLVVADGQPQSFDADLHTVPRRGISQTVDVRAIVQLGVIGGGDSSVTGALLRVVDRYRYSAMGLRARLHNDVFEIRGVETDGNKDYIVKGSRLPPSVSVVSHSQVVSFSEMLRRIQRVATVDEGGSNAAPP